MSDCGCKGKPPAQQDDEAIWEYCEYTDSEVLGGNFWPARQVEPMVLLAGGMRKVRSLSDVCRDMHVHVLSGILSMWWGVGSGDHSSSGDQVHMTWGTGNNHPVRLPPGAHSMTFMADNADACTATVTIMDCEAHQGSLAANARQEANR